MSPDTSQCRPAASLCDIAEFCDGAAVTCPSDVVRAASTLCRAAADLCDAEERCDGASGSCPNNALAPATHECRPAVGGCDAAEYCTGNDLACPSDLIHPSGYECRPSQSPCDPAEVCSGSSTACQGDIHFSAGTDPGGACNGYTCNGTGACRTSCSGGSCTTNCAPGAWCNAGACQPDKANGLGCGNLCECISGVCSSYYATDVDDDNYATGATLVTLCGATPPSNYATQTGDCCDSDSRARPGQTSYFTSANNCASFDYNCANGAERELLGTRGCQDVGSCADGMDCGSLEGWVGAVAPACGASASYVECSTGPAACGPGCPGACETCSNITSSTVRQACR